MFVAALVAMCMPAGNAHADGYSPRLCEAGGGCADSGVACAHLIDPADCGCIPEVPRCGCGAADFADCCCCGCGPKTLLFWNSLCCDNAVDGNDDEPLVTDRPDFTEASSTVGLGRIQVEMGYLHTLDNETSTRIESDSYPEFLARIGWGAEWFELRLGWNYLHESTRVDGSRNRASGAEDMYVGAKIAITEQCGCLPEMAILPQMNVPTGSEAHSDGQIMPGVNWVYSWELSECLGLAGSTQANRVRDDSNHFHLEIAQSIATGISLSDRLGAYAEWFAFFPHSAMHPAASPEHFVDGGFAFLVSNDFQLDVFVGTGLNSVADDFFIGTGFAYRH